MELEQHGVEALLVERNTSTTRHPKMGTKPTWATNAVGWEPASFDHPSAEPGNGPWTAGSTWCTSRAE
jgi:hypothetical protein